MIDMLKYFYELGDYMALLFIFLGFIAFTVVISAAAIALVNINTSNRERNE